MNNKTYLFIQAINIKKYLADLDDDGRDICGYEYNIELAREELEEDKDKIIKTTLVRDNLLDVEELEKTLINDCCIKKAVGDTEIIILY